MNKIIVIKFLLNVPAIDSQNGNTPLANIETASIEEKKSIIDRLHAHALRTTPFEMQNTVVINTNGKTTTGVMINRESNMFATLENISLEKNLQFELHTSMKKVVLEEGPGMGDCCYGTYMYFDELYLLKAQVDVIANADYDHLVILPT